MISAADPLLLGALHRWLASLPEERMQASIDRAGMGHVLHAALPHLDPAWRESFGSPPGWRDAWLAVRANHVAGRGECLDFLATLRQRGIACIPLKGLAAALSVYADPGLRFMADADFLLPPEHRQAAVTAAAAFGFTPSPVPNEPEALLSRRRDGRWQHWELHFSLCQPRRYPLDHARVWQRARPTTIDGRDILLPDPVTQLLHGVINMVHDRFDAPLLKFVELAWLRRRLTPEEREEFSRATRQAECAIAWTVTAEILRKWVDPEIETSTMPVPATLNLDGMPPYQSGFSRWRDLWLGLRLIDKPARRFAFGAEYLLRRMGLRK